MAQSNLRKKFFAICNSCKEVVNIAFLYSSRNKTKQTKMNGVNNMKTTTKMKKRITGTVLTGITAISVFSASLASVAAAGKDSYTKVKYNGNTICYSDDYFRHSSTVYDPHLATLSVITTDNTVPRGNPKNCDDTDWYMKQPNLLRGFYEEIGFTDFDTNEDYRSRTEFDTIGIACARRKIDDYTVIAVSVRSGGYFHEWSNNVWLGDGSKSDYMHEGFYNAANNLIDFLEEYTSSRNITGKVKVWMCGFSRGGATTNIAAGLLDNKIKNGQRIFKTNATLNHEDLYAYTFEAPQGANYNSEKIEKPGSTLYNNIWNVVNPNDLVTKVPMSEWGFTRFGTDKYITTKFYDPDHFEANRKVFKQLYEMNGKKYNEFHGDEFKMYNVPFGTMLSLLTDPTNLSRYVGKWETILENDDCKSNYDANIVSTLFLEELTKVIGTRKNYCTYYQEQMRDLLMYLMDDVKAQAEDHKTLLMEATKASFLMMALGGSEDAALKVMEKVLPSATANSAVKCMHKLAGPLLCVAVERPNELISFAMQSTNVFANHDFDVNIAHLEAQDSYYTDSCGLTRVALRDNADFGRMSFKDFNQIGLYLNKNGLTNKVNVAGSRFFKSNIKRCNAGYAVGYYSYMTESKMEVFMPANQKYVINFQSFSLKPDHLVTYTATLHCIGSNSKHCYKKTIDSYRDDDEFMDSDFMQRGANMKL